ncbi:amino acid adenylation domain-containing protein [Herpetosiphon gulosus]|uniref:Dimodular nonribosomal peptide synthase n=1 Tax=Herpetosiphon gulosus TaxID=1973496 RepID=A0ABP9X7B8_9CHLR
MWQLLAQLRAADIRIWLEGERLCYDAPSGALTEQLLSQLRQHKAELCQFLGQTQSNQFAPIPKLEHDQPVALSFAQQRLWFLHEFAPTSTAYHIPAAIELNGELNRATLQLSFEQLIERHTILRSHVLWQDAQPLQQVAVNWQLPWAFHDLRSANDPAAECQHMLLAAFEAPFDLTIAPSLRCVLVCLAEKHHILLVVQHHWISDGWSIGIMINELAHIYRALLCQQPHQLPALPVQYRDLTVWQRQQLQGARLEQLLTYWRQQLADLPNLALPYEPQNSAQMVSTSIPIQLDRALVERLASLNQAHGTTMFMSLLAGFFALLSRYTQQNDFAVGSPIAGRLRPEAEPLLGCLINSLVLRADLSGLPSFRHLLERVRQTSLVAYAHQELPFELLVEALQPERKLDQQPLFQALFALQNMPTGQLEAPNLLIKPYAFVHQAPQFPLSLILFEQAGQITGELNYDPHQLSQQFASQFAAHYAQFLAQLVAEPDTAIVQIELLQQPEQTNLLNVLNSKHQTYPINTSLVERFSHQASATPQASALSYADQQLSYQQLAEASDQLAYALLAQGVQPEQPIGLLCERSPQLIIGILGILKAGAAYLPLDPQLPISRIEWMLADAQINLIVTQNSLLHSINLQSTKTLNLDQLPSHDPVHLPTIYPNQLAYIIYTSGSTGQPKGTLLSHANVLRLFEATVATIKPDANDVWSLFHSYAFDFSVWEIWGALLYGGRLVVVPSSATRSPEEFSQLLADESITVLNQTPSAFRQLLPQLTPVVAANLALRLIIFGGEALDLASLAAWYQAYPVPAPQLLNMYGITETTVHVTERWLKLDDLIAAKASLIGQPIADLTMYLLDQHGQLVPQGVVGEIYVGGAGLARGYLKQAALTAQRFVPDPWSSTGARLYRSGDLARINQFGELEYLGRGDQQVKVRGFRIELGELEQTICRQAGVADCWAFVQKLDQHERLVAWVVPNQPTLSIEQLRQALAHELPHYLQPNLWLLCEHLPLTNNGKRDYARLLVELNVTFGQAPSIAPNNPIQALIAAIWQEILQQPIISIDQNFFEVGGNSLNAVLVLTRIRELLRVNLSLRSLFAQPTIRGVEQALLHQETKPGQTAKIAELVQKLKQATPEQRQQALASKRQERTVGE